MRLADPRRTYACLSRKECSSNPSSLGDLIKKRRVELGLHQKEVAGIIGINRLTVNRWENNKALPRKMYIPNIEKLLGTQLDLNRPKVTDLGEKIKSARMSKSLSRKELARKVDVSKETVWAWEVGKQAPSSENLKKLRELLNIADIC